MAFKLDTFVKNTATGDQAVTGVGFQPKAVIFWTTFHTASGAFTDRFEWMIGLTDGTRQCVTGNNYADATASNSDGAWTNRTDHVIYRVNSAGTAVARATIVSLDSDGFTINWAANEAVSSIIHYLAIGGASVSARVDSFALSTAGVPPQPQAVSGVGFQPTALIFLPSQTTVNTNNVVSGAVGCLGFTDGTRQGAMAMGQAGDFSTTTKRYQRTNRCMAGLTTGAALDHEAAITSLDSDGFTISREDNASGAWRIFYLALAGVTAFVGSITQPTSTGTQAITGVGFEPECVIFESFCLDAQTTVQDDSNGWLGASVQGGNEGGMWTSADHAASPTVTARRVEVAKAILLATENATGSSSTINADADVQSFDSGGFTLDWTTADATQRQVLYMALAETAPVVATPGAGSLILTGYAPSGNIPARPSPGSGSLILSGHAPDTGQGAVSASVLRGSHNATVNLPFQVLRFPAVRTVSGTPSISVKLRKEDASTGAWTGKLVYYGPPPVEIEPEPEDDGEIAEGTNPDLGASLCDIHDPVMWLELETDEGRKRYSADSDLTHEFTYHGGQKSPRLLRTGPVSRALSDWMGAFESGHTSVELADTDYVIRSLITSGELLNREVALYLIDYAASMLGDTPRRIFSGYVRRYKPLHDLVVRLDLQDKLGALIEQFSDTELLPRHVMDTTMFPNLPLELEGKPIPIIYGACSDEALGSDGKGVVPAIYTGERFIPVHGRNWGEFLIGIGEVDVVGWWGGNAAGTDRAKMPTTTEGVTWLVPGFAGWTTAFGSTRTRTFVNANGESIEATYIYVQGPQWDWARSGQVPITVNVHGRKDATGVMIRSLPLQIADFLINFVLQNGTGPQSPIPTIGDPAYSAVDTASFQEAHEVSSARLGVAGSPFSPYLGAWMLGHDGNRITLAEWIRRATMSCDLDLGINKDGQVMASMLDLSLPITKRFIDQRDIIDQTHDVEVDIEKLHNIIKYRYEQRYITPIEQPTPAEGVRLPKDAQDRDWLSGEQILTDDPSITAIRQEKKLELDLHMVRDQATADSVIAYRLARSKQAPVFGSFETNLCALDVELGKVIGDTHFAGLGPDGWVDERLRLRRLVLQPCDFTEGSDPDSNFRVALTAHDIMGLENPGEVGSPGGDAGSPGGGSPAAGIYGPQEDETQPGGSVVISPGESIQSAVTANPNGTTFWLEAGTHSIMSAITPKTGNTFVGEYGAIIDGSGWSSGDINQGAFRAHNQNIDDVTIRNLVIQNMPQKAVHAYYEFADNWIIEYCEIANNVYGIQLGINCLAQHNYIHDNVGIEGDPTPANRGGGYAAYRGDGSVFQYNEISFNGSEQKIVQADGVVFRENYVHDNNENGIWYDADNTNSLIEDNIVENHPGMGIFYEISGNGTIRNNTVRDSDDTGIFISTSRDLQIYSNTLEDNFKGIGYFVNCAFVGVGAVSADCRDNDAYDNTITVPSTTGAVASYLSWTGCSGEDMTPYTGGAKNLTFENNDYTVPSSLDFWVWGFGQFKSWAAWQALGHDTTGSRTIA